MAIREPKPATLLAAILATETRKHWDTPSGRGNAYQAARDAESLIRLGKRAAKIALDRCNGIQRYDAKAGRVLASWTEADETRADKACDKIARDAAAILQPYGATNIRVGGDPRGYTLKFDLASGRSNSAGGEGWGV